jgi:hypothetical protein
LRIVLAVTIMIVAILGAGCMPAPGTTEGEAMPGLALKLIGNWERLTDSPCSRVYPKAIEFRDGGLYSGTGMQPGNAPGWDSGTWEIVEPNHIRISTINDAIITYGFSLSGDIVTFVAPDKCEFRYRRVDH